jgi:hypothetical protein
MKISKIFKKLAGAIDKMKLDDSTEPPEKLIPFEDIVDSVKNEIKKGVDRLGDKVLVPNVIKIYLSKTDRRKRLDRENILIDEIKKDILSFCREFEEGFLPETFDIQVKTDEKLSEGEFYTEVSIYRVDASSESDIVSELFRMEDDSAEGIYIIEVIRGTERSEYKPEKSEILIGRSKEADIVLEDPDKLISRKHCRLCFEEEGIFVFSSGMNKTFLKKGEDGDIFLIPQSENVKIAVGDTLKIEDYYLKIVKK